MAVLDVEGKPRGKKNADSKLFSAWSRRNVVKLHLWPTSTFRITHWTELCTSALKPCASGSRSGHGSSTSSFFEHVCRRLTGTYREFHIQFSFRAFWFHWFEKRIAVWSRSRAAEERAWERGCTQHMTSLGAATVVVVSKGLCLRRNANGCVRIQVTEWSVAGPCMLCWVDS